MRRGLELLGEKFCAGLRFACSDLWRPYLKVLAEQAGTAIHVLDRFHIMKQLGEAIDDVRAAEARRMKQDGYEPLLKHSRWCLLKRPENLTDQQTVKLAELLRYNLQSVRAYLHREDFQRFWEYESPVWAGRFLDEWCTRVMRSRLEPLKKVARTLRKFGPFKDYAGTLVGEISFTSSHDAEGSRTCVRFQSPCYLANLGRCGIHRPPTYHYHALFEVYRLGYERRVQISQEVKAGDTDRFTARIAVGQSSFHRFRATLRDVSGRVVRSPMIELTCFVPRSRRKCVEHANFEDDDGPKFE